MWPGTRRWQSWSCWLRIGWGAQVAGWEEKRDGVSAGRCHPSENCPWQWRLAWPGLNVTAGLPFPGRWQRATGQPGSAGCQRSSLPQLTAALPGRRCLPGCTWVRSIGPDVCWSISDSKTFAILNWYDSGWWRYQLNSNWSWRKEYPFLLLLSNIFGISLCLLKTWERNFKFIFLLSKL